MRTTLAIARKELTIYFTTPWAFIVFTIVTLTTAFFFMSSLRNFQLAQELARQWTWAKMPPDWHIFKNLTEGVVIQLWGMVVIFMLLTLPMLSMRLLAEEQRQRTMELLMTAPVRPLEIVLGKYLAALAMLTIVIGIQALFPVVLEIFGASEAGQALEWRTVGLGLAGLWVWGATALALGLFLSSLTDSQALAAVLTFVLLLLWMLSKGLTQQAEEPFRSIASYISVDANLQGAWQGRLELKSLVFFLSVITVTLVLTQRRLEASRWA